MSPAPTDALGLVGTIVDQKYRVEAPIGEGGFSVVYRAEHVIWKQPVALKCFNALANVPAAMRADLLQGFIQEGKLMTSLSSRTAAIVQARDVGSLTTPSGQEVPYMVLEWLEGQPLDKVLNREANAGMPARSIHEVLALLEPVAAALDVVHAQGIAHRDIKPANLFVIGDPRAPGAFLKILDFGIAKVMSEHAQLQTALAQTGKDITAFTPNYGAPEQFSRSHGATGPWTDVFALTLIMVEMLRGGVPALIGDDYLQLAIASRDPSVRPTPRSFGVQVTDDVERVFLRALAVAPRERYRTAGELWVDLYGAVFPDSPAWSPMTSTSGGTRAPGTGRVEAHTAPPSSVVRIGGPASARGAAETQAMGHAPTAITGPGATTGQPMAAVTAVPQSRGPALFLGLGAMALLGGVGAAWFVMKGKAPPPVEATAAPAASTADVAAPPAPATCPEGTVRAEGKFFRGSDETTFPLWQPAHKVQLSPYCIDLTEVTAGAYQACVASGGCKRAHVVPEYPKAEGVSDAVHEKNRAAYGELCNIGPDNTVKPGRETHPVNCVTWEMAAEYCKEKGGRLPTEAEWEYAARGSDGRKFPWGDAAGADGKHMNACGTECAKWEAEHGIEPRTPTMYDEDDGFPGTAPVGTFPAGKTDFGNLDMVGNVWEWTADWFVTYSSVVKPGAELIDPMGAPTGDRKAIRGGGFNGGVALWVNPAFRYHQLATASSHGIGFRCAKPLGAAPGGGEPKP